MTPAQRREIPHSRWSRRLAIITWSVVVAWLAVTIFVAVTQAWGYDIRFFWASARTLLDGGDPFIRFYAYPGVNLSGHTQFVGLPWVTLLTVPFALLPFELGTVAWAIYNVGLLLVILGAVYVLARRDLASWQCALLLLCCLWLCLRCLVMGQIGLFVTAVVLVGMILLRHEKWLLGGLCLSLTLFKPWIALGVMLAIGLIAVTQRKWRFFAGLLLGGGGVLALTTVVWPQWLASLAGVDFAFAYGVTVNGIYIVYWPVATVADFMKYVLGWSADANLLLASRLLIVGAIAAAGGLVIQRWWHRKADALLLIGTGALLSALIVPYIRFYDYAILSVWVVGVFAGGKRAGVRPIFLGIAASLLVVAFLLNLGTHPEPWVLQILGWMYLATLIVVWNVPRPGEREVTAQAQRHRSEAEVT